MGEVFCPPVFTVLRTLSCVLPTNGCQVPGVTWYPSRDLVYYGTPPPLVANGSLPVADEHLLPPLLVSRPRPLTQAISQLCCQLMRG